MNGPSLGAFYKQNKNCFLRIAYKVTGGNQVMAEDALHNAFIVIIEQWILLSQLPRDKRRSRCAVIVKNKGIDLLREAKRKDYCVLEDELCGQDQFLELSAVTVSKAGFKTLLHCIAGLPGIYRTVVELRFVKGLSNNETAQLLGITTGAVSTRLYRARRILQEILSNEGFNNR